MSWKDFLIKSSATLRDAMIKIDQMAISNADIFVVNESERVLGSLSDGDIRRALISGGELSDAVTSAMNKDFLFSKGDYPQRETVIACKRKSIRFLPLVSDSMRFLKVIDIENIKGMVPVEAIIMAGGEGKRLRPLTESLPKPLLPLDGKPIIEHNIKRLVKYGIPKIHISINYLGHLLREHFEEGAKHGVLIEYIQEEKPLGTIGAITQLKEVFSDNILVMNSDILSDIDFSDFYSSFLDSGADLAIAATIYSVNIPYAVLETSTVNEIAGLAEKPTYQYYSNAGIYLMKKELIDLIPRNERFDMPDLINKLIKENRKVVSYPIRGYWLDIGRHEDYLKAQDDILHINI